MSGPTTAFVCFRCGDVYRGLPFGKFSEGGLTVRENEHDLCYGCVALVLTKMAQSVVKFGGQSRASGGKSEEEGVRT